MALSERSTTATGSSTVTEATTSFLRSTVAPCLAVAYDNTRPDTELITNFELSRTASGSSAIPIPALSNSPMVELGTSLVTRFKLSSARRMSSRSWLITLVSRRVVSAVFASLAWFLALLRRSKVAARSSDGLLSCASRKRACALLRASVAGVAAAELPLHPETTNETVRTTAYFLTV